MHRFASGDYFLQITKKRMLQMQGKKWLNWLHSVLGRFSTDFWKLLQRYALNICRLNSGRRSFSKSKPQSSLGTMQAWFPMGKPICGPGSCVMPCTCWFSEPGLSYIHHCPRPQPNTPPSPASTLPFSFLHESFIVVSENLSPIISSPLPSSYC